MRDEFIIRKHSSRITTEHVNLEDMVTVDYRNIAWVLAHLTSRLRCDIKDGNSKLIYTQDGLKEFTHHNALRYVRPQGLGDLVEIYHSVSSHLGGVSCCRDPFDSSKWLLTILPEISTRAGCIRKNLNHIGKELFLSVKYATFIENEGSDEQQLVYQQPFYFHPKFETQPFDPSYFTAE